jgi:hypothetical protein
VSPGGYLNQYGWYVIGTTAGGNAVVVHPNEPGTYFADHTWYTDDLVSFENLAGGGEWIDVPMSEGNVRRSLFPLAESDERFELLARLGELDAIIDRID